jgi:hypothetical protein
MPTPRAKPAREIRFILIPEKYINTKTDYMKSSGK